LICISDKFERRMRKIHLLHLFLFIGLASCGDTSEVVDIPEPIELHDFETIVSYDEVVLANPQRVRFDGNEGLIVFDNGLENVMRLSLDGSITHEIGRKGSGPGEYQSASTIYVLEDSIYLVDDRQFIVHQFSPYGNHISSLVYGDFGTHRINKPTVINQEELLIPNSIADQDLFKVINWNGEEFSQLGQVPEGSVDELDYEAYRTAISNREVPDNFKSHVFAVNSGNESVFIVYEAFPKISHYDLSGELIWRTETIDIPEIASVAAEYYNFMDMILRQADAVQPMRKYVDGISKNGRLFVSTNTSHDNPLWIHEFDEDGKLANRYVFRSEVGLKSYFDIDINERRFFVLTEEGELRSYHF